MPQLTDANLIALGAALVLVLVIGLWLLRRASRRTRQRSYRPDVLDEGVAPAERNRALIDAPSAAALAASGPDIFAGAGEVAAIAAAEEIAEAAAIEVAQADGPADDLRRIKGVGPKLVTLLQSLGVTRFEQIAGWSDAELDRIDAQLGTFAGRPRRDAWVEQAKFLAAGDVSGFEAKFGKV